MHKWILVLIAILSLSAPSLTSAAWHGRIIQTTQQKDISLNELTTRLKNINTIILGEIHNTPAIQLAQSLIINHVVKTTHQENLFITAWEFLNHPDQAKIDAAFARFSSGEIDALGFLLETQGTKHNISYIPILETTKALQGKLIGVNISREAKKPVIENGIGALDPKYLPPNFAMGSQNYHERFADIMGDHMSKEALENHYAAQCLTDDIMAYTLEQHAETPLIFLITGSFHADYFDGVTKRIQVRLTNKSSAVIRFIDAADYSEKELQESLSEILYHKTYGHLADYVYFVNEPST